MINVYIQSQEEKTSMKDSNITPKFGNWYDIHPLEYAKGLEYSAARSDECAIRQETEGKPWSAYEADRYRRQARRLRAMVLLCKNTTEVRAGRVDFLGLSDPTRSREEEDAAVAIAERLAQ